ncbi:MAG: RIP metalloprotease RseP [Alloprevotella sp.]|nr:RIP metalloprotease RseP [Alloprevotella sp.]
MEVFLIRAAQLVLCLSILVFLHEGGHFLAAKVFKIRVEKFALFFDPWFSLFKWKPKKSDTTYTLGWLPLGGYVKIAGMVDESMDTKQLEAPVQPWEFRAKPAWQRLIVMLAGVFVNFVVALLIYAVILFTWGETYVPIENLSNGFKFNAQAQELGFQDGDIPLRTDTKTFTRFDSNQSISDVYRAISTSSECTVLRNGKEVVISLPGEINMLDMMKSEPPFMLLLSPSIIDSVLVDSPADQIGLQVGDQIVSFNEKEISTWNEFQDEISRLADALTDEATQADSLRLRQVVLSVKHQDEAVDTFSVLLTPELTLGTMWNTPLAQCETVTKSYSLLSAFPAGVAYGWNVLSGYVNDLKYLFTKEGAKSVGSFGAIGSLFPKAWDWQRFWELTAFISLMLAFMNILPIPALDGGHAFFLLCEVVTRRKPSDKFMARAETIGMTILLLLMVYAIMNDFIRFVF